MICRNRNGLNSGTTDDLPYTQHFIPGKFWCAKHFMFFFYIQTEPNLQNVTMIVSINCVNCNKESIRRATFSERLLQPQVSYLYTVQQKRIQYM